MTNDIRKLVETLDRIATVKESSTVRIGTELMINGRPADLDALVDQHEEIGPALAFGTDADAEEALNDVLGNQDWALIDSETGEILADSEGRGAQRQKADIEKYRRDQEKELEKIRSQRDQEDDEYGQPLDRALVNRLAQKLVDELGNSYPDLDPADAVAKVLKNRGPGDRGYEQVMKQFQQITGAEDPYDYYDMIGRDFG